jgi:hypothetical protein
MTPTKAQISNFLGLASFKKYNDRMMIYTTSFAGKVAGTGD